MHLLTTAIGRRISSSAFSSVIWHFPYLTLGYTIKPCNCMKIPKSSPHCNNLKPFFTDFAAKVTKNSSIRTYKQLMDHDSYVPQPLSPSDNQVFRLASPSSRTYVPTYDLWDFYDVRSPRIDGGDPAVNPSGERMPNGGRVNMGTFLLLSLDAVL